MDTFNNFQTIYFHFIALVFVLGLLSEGILGCYDFTQVWDRRCFVSKGQPAGILMGHLEGITFINSRGDGRYLISNGKDQTTKLWDIRKMTSSSNAVK